MTTRIDLSRLARPTIPGLVLTVDEAHTAILAWLEAEYQWTLTADASNPAWRLSRLLAAREVLIRRSVADSVEQVSLAYARGELLDHIGLTYYRLARLEGELDDDYRARLADAPELYAIGLSGPWYESTARGVAGVFDARFTSPNPGEGVIFIQANDRLVDDMGDALYANGIPTAALLQNVTTAVTAEEDRQQTDTITVSPCTRQRYDVTVTLTLRAEPDSALVLAQARAALTRLAADVDRLGGAIDETLVAGATVNVAATASADVQIATIDNMNQATPVDTIAGQDSVAPQARTLTVALA